MNQLHQLVEAPDLSPLEQAFQGHLVSALSERNFKKVYKLFYDLGAAEDFAERVTRGFKEPETVKAVDPLTAPLELISGAPEPVEEAHDVEVLPHHTDETGEIHVQEAIEKLKKAAPVTALIPGVATQNDDTGEQVRVEVERALTTLDDLLEEGGK